MGFTHMTALTHDMEDVLDGVRSHRIKVSSEVVDVLFQCLDALESYVSEIVSSGQEGQEEYGDIIAALAKINGSGAEKSSQKTKSAQDWTIGENSEEVYSNGLRLKLNIYDKNIIEKALETSMNILQIHVELDKKCLLKAARAFIIFQPLIEMQKS